MLFADWAFQIPRISGEWIPVVAIVAGCSLAAVCVVVGMITRQRLQELEHTLQLRRMEHERRMKELELELARINSGAAARQS